MLISYQSFHDGLIALRAFLYVDEHDFPGSDKHGTQFPDPAKVASFIGGRLGEEMARIMQENIHLDDSGLLTSFVADNLEHLGGTQVDPDKVIQTLMAELSEATHVDDQTQRGLESFFAGFHTEEVTLTQLMPDGEDT